MKGDLLMKTNTNFTKRLARKAPRGGNRRIWIFENFFKILETAGFLALAMVDIVITGSVWSLMNNANFEFVGFTLKSSWIGAFIAMAFWYAQFTIVRFVGEQLNQHGGSLTERAKKALEDERVVLGLVCALGLWFVDALGDSLSGVVMVFPDVTVFTLWDHLKTGPGAMYFIMFVMVILTTLGEPIVFARLLLLTDEKNKNPGGMYGNYRPSTSELRKDLRSLGGRETSTKTSRRQQNLPMRSGD
jgi:hypothetical protein